LSWKERFGGLAQVMMITDAQALGRSITIYVRQ
jgi:hypothetical protein